VRRSTPSATASILPPDDLPPVLMGCVKLAFRLVVALVLAIIVVGAWLYRDQLIPMVRERIDRARGSHAESQTGTPSAGALGRARGKVDSLNAWRADSVVLNAAEMASLIQEGLSPEFTRNVDSLRVALGDGIIVVSGRLDTSVLPRDALGSFSGVLSKREPITASGPVRIVRAGVGEWRIETLKVRDFPIPRAVIDRMATEGLHSRNAQLEFAAPPGVTNVRVRPDGVTLYRGTPP